MQLAGLDSSAAIFGETTHSINYFFEEIQRKWVENSNQVVDGR